MDRIGTIVDWIARYLKKLGPYVLIELCLPGGSLVALLLWLGQRSRKAARNA